jgi:Antibiotic biosynthesis monooxygenase
VARGTLKQREDWRGNVIGAKRVTLKGRGTSLPDREWVARKEGTVFVAVYCWRMKPGMEEQFREGWRRVTETLYRHQGSLGSRLHRNFDGTWVAYAQWPDRKHWEKAQKAAAESAGEGLQMMRDSLEDPAALDTPVFRLVVTDDYLRGTAYSIEMERLP